MCRLRLIAKLSKKSFRTIREEIRLSERRHSVRQCLAHSLQLRFPNQSFLLVSVQVSLNQTRFPKWPRAQRAQVTIRLSSTLKSCALAPHHRHLKKMKVLPQQNASPLFQTHQRSFVDKVTSTHTSGNRKMLGGLATGTRNRRQEAPLSLNYRQLNKRIKLLKWKNI